MPKIITAPPPKKKYELARLACFCMSANGRHTVANVCSAYLSSSIVSIDRLELIHDYKGKFKSFEF